MIRAYLDNNATTRPSPEVVEAVRACMAESYLNPSSVAAAVLQPGQDHAARASRALGELLGTEPEGFFFTSGASEANSWVASLVKPGAHVVCSAIEHPSLRLALEAAERRGVEVTWIAPDRSGVVRAERMLDAIRPNTTLITVMMANNETGVVQPMSAIADGARTLLPEVLVHTDATQAVGRLALDLDAELAGVDLVSLSAHKLHGPRGVGALFARPGIRLEPFIHGEQFGGLRGGTHNSPGLAGLAVAAEQAMSGMTGWHRIEDLRASLEMRLLHLMPGSWINGADAPRLPNTISLTWPGLDASGLVDRLALAGICVATGSACNAGADAPSQVLLDIGLSHDDALATLRISLSSKTSEEEVDLAVVEIGALLAGASAGTAAAIVASC